MERIEACRDLAKVATKNRAAGKALCAVAVTEDKELKTPALEALEKVDGRIHPHVLALLIDADPSQHFQALDALCKSREDALEASAVIIEHFWWNLMPFTRFAPTVPTKFAAHPNSGLIIKDTQALAVIAADEPAACEILYRVAKRDAGLKFADRNAPDITRDFQVVESSISALYALSESKPETRTKAVEAVVIGFDNPLTQKDRFWVQTYLQALMKYGKDAKAIVPTLKKLKFDSDKTTRELAVEALKRIDPDEKQQ
jgi:hypothetical protein